MSDLYLVGYDGTKSAKRAVDFAAARAHQAGAKIHLVNVLEWSPYSFYSAEELASRKKARTDEVKRGQEMLDPLVAELKNRGIEVSSEVLHGHPAELLCKVASEVDATQILIGRSGDGVLAQRLLGGLAISLAQVAPVPLTIVP
ncbi:MAG: universal stress protein [Burkholderiaceae bacterium]